MEKTFIITYHYPIEFKGTYVVRAEDGMYASKKLEEYLRKTYGEFVNASSTVMEMVNGELKFI